MAIEPKQENKTQKTIMTLSIVFGILLIFILIIIKMNVPNFSWGTFIFTVALVVLFFVGLVWLANYLINKKEMAEKEQKEEKLPKAITLEQAREIALNATRNPTYADYIQDCLGESVEQHGRGTKNNIYCYKGRGKYENDIYCVLLNMHFPNEKRTIMINPKPEELLRAKQLLALVPIEEPSFREKITESPLTGIKQREYEVIQPEEKEEKHEEKKEDL